MWIKIITKMPLQEKKKVFREEEEDGSVGYC